MSEELIYSTRREFLCGSLGTLSLTATMPGFLCRAAEAVAAAGPGDAGRVLVVLQLAGGNDGLNTVVPHGLDAYYRSRPRLAIAPDACLRVDDRVGLHPALAGFKALFDDGKLAIIQGVGYPNPNRSHFRSMDIWHSAHVRGQAHSGWLGRYFDNCCEGQDAPDPRSAIALMSESPLALAGERFAALAFEDPERLRWRPAEQGRPRRLALEVFERLNDGPAGKETRPANDELAFLQRTALDARMGAEQVREAARGARVGGRRHSLQAQLGLVARMIQAGFPTRVYYVSMGGFDTHANQSGRHEQLMRELGDAVKSFIGELQQHKLLDRVVLMSFSEFGRRVRENASGGTDHGAAAPMFLIGSRVRPGLHLEHPSLTELDQGDMMHRCDFRRVYAAVLRDWLGANHRKILGRDFKPLKLIKT